MARLPRAPACDGHLYDVRPSFERVDWKFPNFTVTLALGIAERDENGKTLKTWPPSWQPAAFVSDDLVDAYEAAHKKRK